MLSTRLSEGCLAVMDAPHDAADSDRTAWRGLREHLSPASARLNRCRWRTGARGVLFNRRNQAEGTNEHDKEEQNRPIPEAVGPDVKAAGLLGRESNPCESETVGNFGERTPFGLPDIIWER